MEENLRRAMLLSRGDAMVFLERPISGTMIACTAALLAWAVFSAMRQRNVREVVEEAPNTTSPAP